MMMVLLTACETVTFSPAAIPDVVEYSPKVQEAAADEIERNDVPVLTEFMKDYKVMRDQARAAKGEHVERSNMTQENAFNFSADQ